MKTATILFYVSPSLETRIKNAKTIDLMEVEKEQEQFVFVPTDSQMNPCYNGVKDSGDIDADGKEGNADGYSRDSNLQDEDKDDNKDDDDEEGESREEDQVETSPRGHQTHRVEQGPQTPLERAAHE